MKYSFIIPVYNRPDEVDELLDSLARQECRDFEVVVVEDGSAVPCRDVCHRYADRLDLHYYNKENSGPGQSRNYGAERAQGEYLIVLDSDVVLPPGYLSAVDAELAERECDAFGGPDSAHPSVYSGAESHLLLDDELLYHRRNTWRQEETGQILSPLVQYGHPS